MFCVIVRPILHLSYSNDWTGDVKSNVWFTHGLKHFSFFSRGRWNLVSNTWYTCLLTDLYIYYTPIKTVRYIADWQSQWVRQLLLRSHEQWNHIHVGYLQATLVDAYCISPMTLWQVRDTTTSQLFDLKLGLAHPCNVSWNLYVR